jgi:site-specific DNA recombinase
VRALDADGVRTATGRRWHQGTVAKILADPFYIGLLPGEGDPVHGKHEPIIDEEVWNRVATILRDARRTSGARVAAPPAPSSCS